MDAEATLIQCEALLTGHFILTSGRHAGQYMQCAKIQQYPAHMEALAKKVAAGFAGAAVDIVAAPAVGGIVFGYELARQLGAKAIFAERVEGKLTLRRGFAIPAGAKVVIAEDVITTAGTVKEMLQLAQEHAADIVGVGVIVDRSGGTVDLGTRLSAAYVQAIASYPPEDCPLCREGKLPAVKPGSRA